MKYKVLRLLVTSRRFANTEKGERVIVRTLTTMTIIAIADVLLLVFG